MSSVTSSPAELVEECDGVVAPGGFRLGQPKGLFLVAGVEFWERFSYYGIVLDLQKALWFLCVMSATAATLIWALHRTISRLAEPS